MAIRPRGRGRVLSAALRPRAAVSAVPYQRLTWVRIRMPSAAMRQKAATEGRPSGTTMKAARRGPMAVPKLPPTWKSDCARSEEHTSELQSRENLVCRLLLEKKKENK